MRISDWSSDVCSSDLRDRDIHYTQLEMWEPIFRIPGLVFVNLFYEKCEEEIAEAEQRFGIGIRSEEHTSELQSLMRISYAVFCLKNKTTRNHNHQLSKRPVLSTIRM